MVFFDKYEKKAFLRSQSRGKERDRNFSGLKVLDWRDSNLRPLVYEASTQTIQLRWTKKMDLLLFYFLLAVPAVPAAAAAVPEATAAVAVPAAAGRNKEQIQYDVI